MGMIFRSHIAALVTPPHQSTDDDDNIRCNGGGGWGNAPATIEAWRSFAEVTVSTAAPAVARTRSSRDFGSCLDSLEELLSCRRNTLRCSSDPNIAGYRCRSQSQPEQSPV